MSSLIRRIEQRIIAKYASLEAYREWRREEMKKPGWNKTTLKPGRQPKALRRSKKSQRWLAARAARRAA